MKRLGTIVLRCSHMLWLMLMLWTVLPGFSQSSKLIDSLRQSALQSEDDSTRASRYLDLSYAYWGRSPVKAEEMAKKAFNYATRAGHQKLMAGSLNALVVANAMMGNYDSAEFFGQKGIALSRDFGLENEEANLRLNLAIIYKNQGKYEKALYNNYQILDYFRKKEDTTNLAFIYNNIALIYHEKGAFVKALEHLQISLDFKLALKDSVELGSALNNIGSIYKDLELTQQAKDYFNRSIAINIRQRDSSSLALTYNNMADLALQDSQLAVAENFVKKALYIQMKDSLLPGLVSSYETFGNLALYKNQRDSAQVYFERSLALAEQLDDKRGTADALLGLAKIRVANADYFEALDLALKVRATAQALGNRKLITDVNKLLAQVYAGLGQYREAFQAMQAYLSSYTSTTSRESIQRAEAIRYESKIKQQQAALELAKNKATLRNKELEIRNAALTRQRIILIFGGIGMILTLVLLLVLYRFYDSKRKSHRLLETMNREVIRQKQEIEHINKNLDKQVRERTKELEKRNQKLFEYALINAHNIRGPLANILGLLNLMKRHEDNPELREQIKRKLDYSANMLDASIHEINEMLEEDKLYVLSHAAEDPSEQP